jgi:hypothetical protein
MFCFDRQFAEQNVADDFAVFLGHQGSDHRPIRPKVVNETCFVVTAEGQNI